ncbi:MAG TPA: hypothetical protein VK308_07105, partial [Pyrinomonadaceae bacterium]|nr:hypothetical protein [Pyrinomonadaceae bacterium]
SVEELRRTIEKCGFAMAGQTSSLVPADRKLYALRDATATVESIPLIVASIMSKKLAEGLDALVLDVKTGSGAFMREFDDSKRLAEALVKTGNAFGVRTEAVISDMNQPLGKYVGNALEVYECVKILRGETDERMQPTLELSIELAARMLVLCGIGDTIQNSKFKIQNSLESGTVLEKFRHNVELQNGDAGICDEPEILLEKNLTKIEVKAGKCGFISEISANVIGECISQIGGGRIKVEDKIESGETLGVIYCRNESQADSIYEKLVNAYRIVNEKPVEKFELIKEIVN